MCLPGARMRLICITLACGLATGCGTQPPPADSFFTQASGRLSGSLPHAEALRLVLEQCGPQIDALELERAAADPRGNREDRWWFDTDRRAWAVKRPVGPGFVDSTHWFDVQYEIDGKVVATWFVDTRKGTV